MNCHRHANRNNFIRIYHLRCACCLHHHRYDLESRASLGEVKSHRLRDDMLACWVAFRDGDKGVWHCSASDGRGQQSIRAAIYVYLCIHVSRIHFGPSQLFQQGSGYFLYQRVSNINDLLIYSIYS